MRAAFPGFFPTTQAEYERIWASGQIVLDTNVLLNLYRYNDEPRKSLLGALEAARDKLWMPRQVGSEFFARRPDIIRNIHAPYNDIIQDIDRIRSEVEKKFDAGKRLGLTSEREYLLALEKALRPISDGLTRDRDAHLGGHSVSFASDGLLKIMEDLYENRVGPPYSDEQLVAHYAEAQHRIDNKVPPGYKDAQKPSPDKYGDYLVWRQILDRGGELRIPTLLVTDDRKEDWWERHHGEYAGARHELVDEYVAVAQERVHFMTPSAFIQWVGERSGQSVSASSLAEIEAVSSSVDRANRVAQGLRKKRNSVSERLRAAERSLDQHLSVIERERSLVDRDVSLDDLKMELDVRYAERERLREAIAELHSVDLVVMSPVERAELLVEFDRLDRDLKNNRKKLNELQSVLAAIESGAVLHGNERSQRAQRLADVQRRRVSVAVEEIRELDELLYDLEQLEGDDD